MLLAIEICLTAIAIAGLIALSSERIGLRSGRATVRQLCSPARPPGAFGRHSGISPTGGVADLLWAQDLGAEKNQSLIEYFNDRQVWLVKPDERAVRVEEYR